MKTLLFAASLLALASCATDPDWSWHKAGADSQMFNIDGGQCRSQAFSVPGVTTLQAALVYDGCMHGKGWQKVARNTFPQVLAPSSPLTPSAKVGCDLVKDANGESKFVCP